MIKKRSENIDFRIITGISSMDFTDRMQNMLRNLLGGGIKIKTTEQNLHAKLIVTDKRLAVGSINLNKINLGFSRTAKIWRENTETVAICSNPAVIAAAKTQYEMLYDSGVDISIKLAEKIEKEIAKIFRYHFGLRSRTSVKRVFSRLILLQQINGRRIIYRVCTITANLMDHFGRTRVELEDFVMALVLYYLSERKQDYNEINDKLNELGVPSNLGEVLQTLVSENFIEKEGDYYKLRVYSLF